jgi:5'-deoxynucleotidase
MAYSFFALISRMRFISRWSLMRNSYSENIQEHSHMVAVLAHALAVIRRDVFSLPADPDACAAAALFHDAPEIFTGDLPTPVKYFSPEIREAYGKVEAVAGGKLLSMLPEAMQPAYRTLLQEEDKEVRRIVKAADKLAAYIKCLEELKAGVALENGGEERSKLTLEEIFLSLLGPSDRPQSDLSWLTG